MDDIRNKWKQAKDAVQQPTKRADELISEAKKKKKSVLYFQYGNIAVLSATLIMISFFFFRLVVLKTDLSQAGIILMLSALAIRILIEVYSILKSKRIALYRSLSQTTQDALNYYNYRKRVHGPVTIITVALYVVGYALLSPEFAIYIKFKWMVLMHVSFVFGGAFLIWQIRKGILKELENLNKLAEWGDELSKG